MKKVLATSWHPGGAKAIAPVIKALAAEGRVEVIVLGHEFSKQIFDNAGIPYKTIKDFGETNISRGSMLSLLVGVSPDIVLTGTSGQEGNANDIIEHTMTLAARDWNIKSVAVLDYWANYSKRFSDERTGNKLDVLPDKIAIMDKIARDDMLAEGFPAEKLVITGNPNFDILPAKAQAFTQEMRDQVRQAIGLPCQTLFFFAAGVLSRFAQKIGFWDMDVLKVIANALPNLPGVGIAMRLHPRTPTEDKSQIEKFIADLAGKVKLVEDVNSLTLALAADLTIVQDSTVGIEAIYMGRPCISLQPELKVPDSFLPSKKGVALVAYESKGCEDLLLYSADPKARARMVKIASKFVTDGKATERVAQLVYSLLN